jgi:hypothetical protein
MNTAMRTLRMAALACIAIGASVALALTTPLGADYPGPPCDVCDFAGPPIDALAHGHVAGFFHTQPVMGSLSLLVRAPFAAVAHAFDGGQLLAYRLGALPCLLVAALFALALARLMARRGQPFRAQLAVVALVVAGPLTSAALKWGHPEELLAAALCVGGAIAAVRGRVLVGGLLLGLALATKEWAWLAILPVAITVSTGRIRMLVVAGGTAALFALPMLIGDPGRFIAQIHHYGVPGNGLTPANVWWVYGHEGGLDLSGGGFRGAATYALPDWLGHASHMLVIAVALGLSLSWLRVRRGRDPHEVLQLIALVFLLRCMLDPLTYSYHHVPFAFAVMAYEGLCRRGMPWVAGFSSLGIWVMSKWIAPLDDPTLLNRFYLAWTVPVAAYLAFSLYAHGRVRLRRDLGEPALA